MNLTVRKYKPDDAPELRRIFLESRRKAFFWADPEGFELSDFDVVTRGEVVFVAVQEGVPVGFIAWWPPEDFIHSLFIDPACTGMGVGKMLLNACLSELGRPATLKCLQANTPALEFYKAQGWEIGAAGKSDEGDYFVLTFS